MASASVHSSQTSHWPLCSGGVSLRKQCDNRKETLLIKWDTKKRIHTWRMHKPAWLFQEYLIRLSEKESCTTYLIRLQSHPDLPPQILPELKCFNTLLVVFGDKELQRACSPSPVFTCRTCFMLASCIFCSSSTCLRDVICLHFFSGNRNRNFSSSLTHRFVGLVKSSQGSIKRSC